MRIILLFYTIFFLSCNDKTESKKVHGEQVLPQADTAHITIPEQGPSKTIDDILDSNKAVRGSDISDTFDVQLTTKFIGYRIIIGKITNKSRSTAYSNVCIDVNTQSSGIIGTHCLWGQKILPQRTIQFETRIEVYNATVTYYGWVKSADRAKID